MPSVIFPEPQKKTSALIDNIAINSIKIALSNKIININNNHADSHLYNIYPGEHYRLLKAITEYMNPKVIVEIGTFTGMGVYSMIQGLNKGKIYTYDIVEWNKFETHLEKIYFENGSVTQIIADLSNKNDFILNKDILNSAEMIFLDAPKNVVFEKNFLKFLTELNPVEKRILVIDDIKFMNMIDLWVNIKSPKVDVTSFGHWTGTGLVDISDGIKFW
ncbi:hypothetical protein G6733_01785 [Polynucleobacter paneuropaeus]|nr:hypothetical protein G6733_01785 [Polynucleobacter paneuropaeus]